MRTFVVAIPFTVPAGIADSDGYPVDPERKELKVGTQLVLSVEGAYHLTSLLDIDSGERAILLNSMLESLIERGYLKEIDNV